MPRTSKARRKARSANPGQEAHPEPEGEQEFRRLVAEQDQDADPDPDGPSEDKDDFDDKYSCFTLATVGSNNPDDVSEGSGTRAGPEEPFNPVHADAEDEGLEDDFDENEPVEEGGGAGDAAETIPPRQADAAVGGGSEEGADTRSVGTEQPPLPA